MQRRKALKRQTSGVKCQSSYGFYKTKLRKYPVHMSTFSEPKVHWFSPTQSIES